MRMKLNEQEIIDSWGSREGINLILETFCSIDNALAERYRFLLTGTS